MKSRFQGPSTERFEKQICKMLNENSAEHRTGSFLKQRISLAIQVSNAASPLGTVNEKDVFVKFIINFVCFIVASVTFVFSFGFF